LDLRYSKTKTVYAAHFWQLFTVKKGRLGAELKVARWQAGVGRWIETTLRAIKYESRSIRGGVVELTNTRPGRRTQRTN